MIKTLENMSENNSIIFNANEMSDHLEQSKLLSSRESVIVLANGVKIHSTLNPNAKEFYPSYMRAKFPEYGKMEMNECKNKLEGNMTKQIPPPIRNSNTINMNHVLRELQDEDGLKPVTGERPKGVLKIIEIIESVNDKNNIKNAEDMASLLPPPINILEKMPVIAKDPKDLFFGRPIISNNNLLNASNNFSIKSFERQECSQELEKTLDKEQHNTQELNNNSAKEIFETVEDVGDHKCEKDIDEEIQINQLSKSQTALMPTITKETLDGLAPPTTPTNDCCVKTNEKNIKNVTFEENPPKGSKTVKTSSKFLKAASTTKTTTTANNKKSNTEKIAADKRKELTTDLQNKANKNRSNSNETNKVKPSNDLKSSTVSIANKTSLTRTINTSAVMKSKATTEIQKRQCTSKTAASSSKFATTLSKEKENPLQSRKSSCMYTSSKSSSVPSVSDSKISTFSSKSTGHATAPKSKETMIKATRSTLVTSTRKKDT